MLPNAKKRKVRVGAKLSASTVKRSEFDTSASRDALHERESASLQPKMNTQEPSQTKYFKASLRLQRTGSTVPGIRNPGKKRPLFFCSSEVGFLVFPIVFHSVEVLSLGFEVHSDSCNPPGGVAVGDG